MGGVGHNLTCTPQSSGGTQVLEGRQDAAEQLLHGASDGLHSDLVPGSDGGGEDGLSVRHYVSVCCVNITQATTPSSVIYLLTACYYSVYACVLSFSDVPFFIGALCLALCFVVWVAHGAVVPCEELIGNPGKYCAVLLLKQSERQANPSHTQRVEKYCK